jgi:hypothetical protein
MGIKTGYVGTFIAIAVWASECEIAGNGLAPVLLRNDVVNLKGQRQCRLWNAAVFTPFSGSLSNGLSEVSIHWRAKSGSDLRRRRALDCITPKRIPMCR